MTLNASGCSVRSVTKHRMSLASHKYISLLKVKMKSNTFVQTAQILLKTVTITCDSVEFHRSALKHAIYLHAGIGHGIILLSSLYVWQLALQGDDSWICLLIYIIERMFIHVSLRMIVLYAVTNTA